MTAGIRLTLGDPDDVTLPSEDGRSMRLRFSVVPSKAAGTGRETAETTRHELVVRLSADRARSWGLDPARALAVMIHAAIEHLFDVARERDFPPSEELRIDDETFPGPMPERFDRPIVVAGSTIEMASGERARGR